MPHQTLTRDEVAKHNTPEDLWCIVDHKVYDLSDFADAHPGGSVVLHQIAGQDATTAFYNLHRNEVLQKYSSLCIGVLDGETPEVVQMHPGDLSPVPYAEPGWLRPNFYTPYFNEKHRKFQKELRKFVDTYVAPEALAREADGKFISQELVDRMAETNILAMRLGPGPHLKGRTLMGGIVAPDEYDYLYELIMSQEMARPNARGFQDGNMAGMLISLTAVREWLNDVALRDQITEECLSGKKKICLAVTEAFAGSDVAGIRTTATKTPDGSHYIISGTKKWITNAMFCDYFVVACKTEKGFSVILVPRQDGIETSHIKTSYSPTAGTAFVEFDNVKVPVKNLMGRENDGFRVIMSNFNHERWGMCCAVIRKSRTVVEECLKWANQRVIFGKRLIDQPVIRQK
jgi:alkylation response protein AidB-like acyl-CoA dehydrogenase/predicted heme/steroid binding protein